MAKEHDILELICERYWNAYRDGFVSIGGSASYPTWVEFSEAAAKDETRRCMRHALEVLKELPDSAFTDDLGNDTQSHIKMERGSHNKVMARILSGKPLSRKKAAKMLQAELQAESLNKAGSKHDA